MLFKCINPDNEDLFENLKFQNGKFQGWEQMPEYSNVNFELELLFIHLLLIFSFSFILKFEITLTNTQESI